MKRDLVTESTMALRPLEAKRFHPLMRMIIYGFYTSIDIIEKEAGLDHQ